MRRGSLVSEDEMALSSPPRERVGVAALAVDACAVAIACAGAVLLCSAGLDASAYARFLFSLLAR
jgi:hypothetical protein